jgi:NitT/TauT family transport system permease protein
MRRGRLETLRWVILPSITPWLLTSLRLSIGLGLIGAVISELVAATEGLGYYIKLSSNLFDTTGVFAGLIVITLVAMVLEQLVVLLERRVLRYR